MTNKYMLEDGIGYVELLDTFGDDITVVNAARVSLSKESSFTDEGELKNSDKKLIKYLAEHNHDSPFFHPQARFRIKMPISIVREWYRHTVGLSRNEVSRRYVKNTPECFVPHQLRKTAPNVKQGSLDESIKHEDDVKTLIKEFNDLSIELYEKLMNTYNVCPEQARLVLPQSMYTEFIETGSLAAYARIYSLRSQPDAQKEIQEYSNAMAYFMSQKFPDSWNALTKWSDE